MTFMYESPTSYYEVSLQISEERALALAYIDVCCFSLDSEGFKGLLADSVSLSHETNRGPIFRAQGRDEVAGLFKKYLFDNTSGIDLKGFTLEEREEGILILLEVEENKLQEGLITRYRFKERTFLQFQSDPWAISSIDTQVERALLTKCDL